MAWWWVRKLANGSVDPAPNKCRRDKFVRAFQRLLVGGTAGACFIAIARNHPLHLEQFHIPFNLDYTLTLFLKYGCLLWLLVYFFTSSTSNDVPGEENTRHSIIFDVGQSVAALVSAVLLGFIVPDRDYGNSGLLATNVTILLICIASLFWFNDKQKHGINRLRWYALVAALVSLVLVAFGLEGTTLYIFGGLHLFLWAVLVAFVNLRIDAGSATVRPVPSVDPAPPTVDESVHPPP